MIPRQSPLDGPAILFADQGAPSHGEPDTEASFRLAVKLGATGFAADLRSTADGVAVIRRDPRLGGLRRRRVSETAAADLPDEVLTLDALYGVAAEHVHVMLRVHDPAVVESALAAATRHRCLERTWLVGTAPEQLAAWHERSPLVRLVDATPVESLAHGLERHAALLREADVDALLMPRREWTGGRTALLHRFGRRCFAADAPHERMVRSLLHIGVDGVCSTHPDRLVDAARAIAAPDAPQFLDD